MDMPNVDLYEQLNPPAIYRGSATLEFRLPPNKRASQAIEDVVERVRIKYLLNDFERMPLKIDDFWYKRDDKNIPYEFVINPRDNSLIARIQYRDVDKKFPDNMIYIKNGKIFVIIYKGSIMGDSNLRRWRSPKNVISVFEDKERVFESGLMGTYRAYEEEQEMEKNRRQRKIDEENGVIMFAQLREMLVIKQKRRRLPQKRPNFKR